MLLVLYYLFKIIQCNSQFVMGSLNPIKSKMLENGFKVLNNLRYGEVYWTLMDEVPLDKSLVDRFNGKVMAIVGFEADQVNNYL